jgi:hypothetical protein
VKVFALGVKNAWISTFSSSIQSRCGGLLNTLKNWQFFRVKRVCFVNNALNHLLSHRPAKYFIRDLLGRASWCNSFIISNLIHNIVNSTNYLCLCMFRATSSHPQEVPVINYTRRLPAENENAGGCIIV